MSCVPSRAASIPRTRARTTTSASSITTRVCIEEAVAAFTRALELDSKMRVAQRNLEIAYFSTGYYDRRVATLRERLRDAPGDRDARWELGRAYSLLGRFTESTAEFAELLKHHPNDLGALVQLGLAEKVIRRSRASAAVVRARTRARSRKPGHPALHWRGPVQSWAERRGPGRARARHRRRIPIIRTRTT